VQAGEGRGKERKGKEEYLYSAFLHQGTHKARKDERGGEGNGGDPPYVSLTFP